MIADGWNYDMAAAPRDGAGDIIAAGELVAAIKAARADPHGGKVMLSVETAEALAAGPGPAMAALIGRLAALPTRAEFVGAAGPRKPGYRLDAEIRESRRILAELAAPEAPQP